MTFNVTYAQAIYQKNFLPKIDETEAPKFQQKVKHCCCPMSQHRATSSRKNRWQHHGGTQWKGSLQPSLFFFMEGAATSTAWNDRQSRLPAIDLTWNAKLSPVMLSEHSLKLWGRTVCVQTRRLQEETECKLLASSRTLQSQLKDTYFVMKRLWTVVMKWRQQRSWARLTMTTEPLGSLCHPQEAVVGAEVCIGMPANLPATCVTRHNCLLLSLRKWKPQQTFRQIAQTPRRKLPT